VLLRDLRRSQATADDDLAVRLKRQELQDVVDEVGEMTARSEVLRFELERLEQKLAERKRAEEMVVQMEVESYSEEETAAGIKRICECNLICCRIIFRNIKV